MKVIVHADLDAIGSAIADSIQQLLSEKPNANLGVATGSSPLAVYRELARRHRDSGLSFAQAQAFMLDEYVGLAEDHPERYFNVIDRDFASHLDFAEGTIHGPNGLAEDVELEAREYDESITVAGGVDLQILGVGSNGHIAFNEPGSELDSRTGTIALTDQTRSDNARFFDDDVSAVPKLALTQGLGTIMEARKLVLIALGEGKADAVHALIEGQVTPEWPVSILQKHPDVTVYLDTSAAGKLTDPALYLAN
ncbi:glucosamine-6-phosphate deaminase [Corynebacterium halotolerans]|uniref:glucosamine-6-phosphate deaminase n=1 Tax=Corynebacterium halotolerans TaxID=225326 RepID=UPI003CF98C4D